MKKNTKMEEPRILRVEDGSVDIDELKEYINNNNMNVYVLVYRQGSTPPTWLEEIE